MIFVNSTFFLFFKFVEKFLLNDPDFEDEVPVAYLSHKELYENEIRKTILLFRKARQMQEEGKYGAYDYLYVIGCFMNWN